jgi:hypothetical protein
MRGYVRYRLSVIIREFPTVKPFRKMTLMSGLVRDRPAVLIREFPAVKPSR